MAKNGIPLLRIVNLKMVLQINLSTSVKVNPKFISTKEDIILPTQSQVGLVFRGRHGIVHNNCFRVIPYENISREVTCIGILDKISLDEKLMLLQVVPRSLI